jgi:parvulin-like peptidyl-prolyl isomerase
MKRFIVTICALAAAFIYAACDTTEQEVKHDDTVLTPPAASQQASPSKASAQESAAGEKSGQTAEKAPSDEQPSAQPQGSSEFESKKLDKGIIAIIGEYVLTKDKYRTITEYMNQKYDYKLTPEQEKEFIQFIVNKKLMAMEARSQGYADRPDIKAKYEWDFDDILSHVYFAENVEKKSSVSDKDAKTYFEAHTGDFVEIKAMHILVKSKQLAESLYKRINDGEEFSDLAKKYSEDATTKEKGGDLGSFGKGVMVQEFEDAAFGLSDNEVSEPIKTVYGWHIIKVLSRKKFTYDESKDKIINMIKDKKQQQVFDSVLSSLKKKYKVTVNEDVIGK